MSTHIYPGRCANPNEVSWYQEEFYDGLQSIFYARWLVEQGYRFLPGVRNNFGATLLQGHCHIEILGHFDVPDLPAVTHDFYVRPFIEKG